MTASELKNHPVTQALRTIQESLGLKDIPFADQLRLGIHGANWGKILSGSYTGSFAKVLTKLEVALDAYHNPASGETEEGIVVLPHVREALDAMELATLTENEHRLVIIAGKKGAGKTRTMTLVQTKLGGKYMEALPSWGGSYFDFLIQFAAEIGVQVTAKHSKGSYEAAILGHLTANPTNIFVDEFNYFSPSAINFLKAILNRTKCRVMLGSVPHFLSRMASDARTAQESSQLFRRAQAIIHIPSVQERDVIRIQSALFPDLTLTTDLARDIAAAANAMHLLDSVHAILEDSASVADVSKSIGRHKRAHTITLRPGEQ